MFSVTEASWRNGNPLADRQRSGTSDEAKAFGVAPDVSKLNELARKLAPIDPGQFE